MIIFLDTASRVIGRLFGNRKFTSVVTAAVFAVGILAGCTPAQGEMPATEIESEKVEIVEAQEGFILPTATTDVNQPPESEQEPVVEPVPTEDEVVDESEPDTQINVFTEADLPEEFLDLGIDPARIVFEGDYLLVDGEIWYEKLESGRLLDHLFVYESTDPDSIVFEENESWGLVDVVTLTDHYTRAKINGKISEIGRYRDFTRVRYYADLSFPAGGEVVTIRVNLGIGNSGAEGKYYDFHFQQNIFDGPVGYLATEFIEIFHVGDDIKIMLPYDFTGGYPDYFSDISNRVSEHGANARYFAAFQMSDETKMLVEMLTSGQIDPEFVQGLMVFPDFIVGSGEG